MTLQEINLFLIVLLFSFPVSAQTKDDGQAPFSDDSIVVNDKDFHYMRNLDSMLQIVNHDADSVASLTLAAPKREGRKSPSVVQKFFNSGIVKTFFWMLLAGFVLAVIYKLFRFNPFSGRVKDADGGEVVINDQLHQPDWYQIQIRAAEADKNFMLAIRYRFMQVLSVLAEKKLIDFLPEKTNSGYLSELEDGALRDHFSRAIMIYEYVWYGRKTITEEQYNSFRALFDQTNSFT